MNNQKDSIIEMYCVQLPLTRENFTDEQLTEIAQAFVFSQISALLQQGVTADVQPVGDIRDLLFCVTTHRAPVTEDALEKEFYLAQMDTEKAIQEFQRGLTSYMAVQ